VAGALLWGGESRVWSVVAGGAHVVVPAGIEALMGDIDCFAKEWAEMFDDLFAGADCPENLKNGPSKLDGRAATRIHPIGQPGEADICPGDNTAAGKRTQKFPPRAPSGLATPVRILQADNVMTRDAPVEDKPVSNHYPPYCFSSSYRCSSLS